MISGTLFVHWRILGGNGPWIGGVATMNSVSLVSRPGFLIAIPRVDISVRWRDCCFRLAPANGSAESMGPHTSAIVLVCIGTV